MYAVPSALRSDMNECASRLCLALGDGRQVQPLLSARRRAARCNSWDHGRLDGSTGAFAGGLRLSTSGVFGGGAVSGCGPRLSRERTKLEKAEGVDVGGAVPGELATPLASPVPPRCFPARGSRCSSAALCEYSRERRPPVKRSDHRSSTSRGSVHTPPTTGLTPSALGLSPRGERKRGDRPTGFGSRCWVALLPCWPARGECW